VSCRRRMRGGMPARGGPRTGGGTEAGGGMGLAAAGLGTWEWRVGWRGYIARVFYWAGLLTDGLGCILMGLKHKFGSIGYFSYPRSRIELTRIISISGNLEPNWCPNFLVLGNSVRLSGNSVRFSVLG
jgi:hypothetical protein